MFLFLSQRRGANLSGSRFHLGLRHRKSTQLFQDQRHAPEKQKNWCCIEMGGWKVTSMEHWEPTRLGKYEQIVSNALGGENVESKITDQASSRNQD